MTSARSLSSNPPKSSQSRLHDRHGRVRTRTGVVSAITALALTTLVPSVAHAADRPYVTIRDDGTIAALTNGPQAILKTIMKAYDKTGAERPDVISLWTNYSMEKGVVGTRFLPGSNDVKGIGLEKEFGGDGTFTSAYAPVRAVLLHNDVTALKKRADAQKSPVEGLGEYLFLLELSHLWGPAARIPEVDGGSPDGLIGFPFHWSFWMDADGSPAGGNKWKNNGDGTFTTLPQTPATVTFSMLDLYLMGMADPSEVAPFGLLENVVPPAGVKDPFTGKALAAQTFPHFGETPITVTATRRALTIDDVVTQNGARVPARKDAPQTLKLGIVLSLAPDSTEEEIAEAEAAMDELAPKLAPSFERATRGRGTMPVVTRTVVAEPDAGAPASEVDAGAPVVEAPVDEGGCSTAGSGSSAGSGALTSLLGAMVGATIVGGLVRRRRAKR